MQCFESLQKVFQLHASIKYRKFTNAKESRNSINSRNQPSNARLTRDKQYYHFREKIWLWKWLHCSTASIMRSIMLCRKNWRIVNYFLSLCIFNIHFTSVLFIPENKCFRLGGTSPHSGHVIWYKATSPLSINLQWLHGLDIIIADLKADRRLRREDLFFSLWPPRFAFVSSKYA